MSERGLVIAGADQWSRIGAILRSLPPPSWLKRLRGPAMIVEIGEDGARIVEHRHWWRPIEIVLLPDLLLSKRLALPVSARADLASAVKVMVAAATPFTPPELLIHVRELDRSERAGEVAYDVHLTPRDRIAEALASLGLAAWRISTIVPLEAATAQATPNFSRAFSGVGRLVRLAPMLPLLAVGFGLVMLSQTHLGGLRAENAILEQAIAERAATTRSGLSALAERQQALEVQASIDLAFAETPSVFLLLEQIRAHLPSTVSVSRVSLDGAALRLGVRAPEILPLLRGLALAMPTWSVSVEGSIDRSPDGAEAATLLLQWTGQ